MDLGSENKISMQCLPQVVCCYNIADFKQWDTFVVLKDFEYIFLHNSVLIYFCRVPRGLAFQAMASDSL